MTAFTAKHAFLLDQFLPPKQLQFGVLARIVLLRCREDFLVRHLVRLFLSAVLVLISLPFFAVSFLIAAICATAASVMPRFHRRQTKGPIVVHQLQRVDPCGFEHAISNYEDLIGIHAWKRP